MNETTAYEASPRIGDNLALAFQEILTATVRLRSNRQAIPDSEAFRAHMREALKTADRDGRAKGYTGDDLKLAVFAVVAFLDESVLNSQNPVFAHWARKPMQEELFGGHTAGEMFFENIDGLLRKNDSREVADVLEVYDLCLLLGYQGRYTLGNRGELRATKESITEKIRRSRRGSDEFSPSWAPGAAAPALKSDPIRRWIYVAAGCLALALILFIVYKFSLSSGVSEIRELASQSRAL